MQKNNKKKATSYRKIGKGQQNTGEQTKHLQRKENLEVKLVPTKKTETKR